MSLLQSPSAAPAYPAQPLAHLDALWIQVAGTLCNLSCGHCFVSSGPGNHRHALMSRAEVAARVAEALSLGVREFYFTGGEPFLHPELTAILADTLAHGPCTVLTNGTLLTERVVAALAGLSAASRYSLEIRVSLDGDRAAEHDAVRGHGSFERALAGLSLLASAGLLPILTVTERDDRATGVLRESYLALLRSAGVTRPRLKVLPLFRLGRETGRSRGYDAAETLADLPAVAFDPARLQCGTCRAVSSRGVFVCPLLVDEPGGRMGARLDQALGPFTLSHGACHTCYVTGMTCANG
ncbi:MAG TPA: radical SAM protein [Candidatus Eisenbacteria bacterium]|nr:radical SAM protein [Candidatus Eisenbacteria bacterium]